MRGPPPRLLAACAAILSCRRRPPPPSRAARGRRAVGDAAARRRGVERGAARGRAVRFAAHAGRTRDRGVLGDAHPMARRWRRWRWSSRREARRRSTSRCVTRSRTSASARDVDLSRIPDDGHAAAIAIEADELLRASWAEVALDTARARQAQQAPGRRSSAACSQVMAPSRAESGGGLGARGASSTTSAARRCSARTRVGRVRLSPRLAAGDRGRAAHRPVGDGAARPG